MAQFSYRYEKGEFFRGIAEGIREPIAEAASAAVTEAGKLAVKGGRASIAAAGFGGRWQTGLKSRVTPKGPAIDVVAHITHSRGIAAIFEFGGTIRGKPLLWIPISGAPPRRGAGRLFSVNRPGRRPLLVGGPERKPILVGVPFVNIGKRFAITEAVRDAASRVADLYFQYLKV